MLSPVGDELHRRRTRSPLGTGRPTSPCNPLGSIMRSRKLTRRMLLAILVLSTSLPSLLPAQRRDGLRVGVAPHASVDHAPEPLRPVDTLKGTYWWVGAIATGVPAGVLAFTAFDSERNGVLKRFIGAAAVGALAALPGALIGSWFKKSSGKQAPGQGRVDSLGVSSRL